jgi:hypothetical protein
LYAQCVSLSTRKIRTERIFSQRQIFCPTQS